MADAQQNNIPPGIGWQPVYIKKSRGAGFWIAVGLASFFFVCTFLFFILFLGSFVLNKAFVTSTSLKARKRRKQGCHYPHQGYIE